MFEPIQPPKGYYSAGAPLNFSRLPLYTGDDFIIEEPALLATEVSWHGVSGMTTVNERGPEPELGRLLAPAQMGEQITVCVCLHGDNTMQHMRCLQSIINTVPAQRLDLRVGLNAVSDATRKALETASITKVYDHRENIYKYPMMRQMFYDESQPITTDYVAWFDGDVYVRHKNWVNLLAMEIVRQTEFVGAYGIAMMHLVQDVPRLREWLKARPWYRGQNLRTRRGTAAPNGDTIHLLSGWFWVASMAAIRAADIPDTGLLQRGGDIVIGEQLHQAGIYTKTFNSSQELVYRPPNLGARLRSGQSQRLPWDI